MPIVKTIQEHKQEGTYRGDRHDGKNLDSIAVDVKIKPPRHMHTAAAKVWRKLLPIVQRGQVLETDLMAFEVLCYSWADYYYCMNAIVTDKYVQQYTNTEGATNTMRHPLSTDKKQAYDMLQQMMAKFGLTPADRSKIIISINDDIDDEMADFI